MTSDSLTKEQQRVLAFIVKYRESYGFPPTVREIASSLGYRSPNNVRQHLRLIDRKGFITLVPGKARGIEIPDVHHSDHCIDSEATGIPLIGSVAAGTPITAIENIESYLAIDRSIFKENDLFALHIKGDSMIDMGILDGDIAVIMKQSHAEHGEVVVVVIDGDATLKRLIKKEGTIKLHAENQHYNDIELNSGNVIQIAGKLAGIIRKY